VNIYRWSKCKFLVPLDEVGALYSNIGSSGCEEFW
jgi:hypothetical protein